MVQVINRTLKLLEILPEKEEGFGILKLAEKLNLPPSTIHRILATLKSQGYVIQDSSTEKYKLGYKILSLARRVLGNQSLKNFALPYLKELKEKTGETAHLVILEGEEAICIESIESSHNIRMCSEVGDREPLHCTAVGKSILACLPKETIKKIIRKPLKRYTSHTITNLKELHTHLKEIKRQGYAFDNGEYVKGVKCVAAPIINSEGKVAGSIGVSGPSFRLTKNKIEKISLLIRNIASKISQEYQGG